MRCPAVPTRRCSGRALFLISSTRSKRFLSVPLSVATILLLRSWCVSDGIGRLLYRGRRSSLSLATGTQNETDAVISLDYISIL